MYDVEEWKVFNYFKLGDGFYYVLVKNFYFCQYEIVKIVCCVINGGGVFFNNFIYFILFIVGIVKIVLLVGICIDCVIGGFQVWGEVVCIQDVLGYVFMGLIQNVVIICLVEVGQILSFDDVELFDLLVLDIFCKFYV